MRKDLQKTSTMEEWENYGERLCRLNRELVSIGTEDTVPKELSDMIQDAIDDIDKARSEWEKRMYKEHPEEADIQTFYGGPSDDYTTWRKELDNPHNPPEDGP